VKGFKKKIIKKKGVQQKKSSRYKNFAQRLEIIGFSQQKKNPNQEKKTSNRG
jgi:hypothetical protein